jgi:hypothetical protein
MSFGAYQDLGSNRILLVEGPTEVTAISQFLRMIGKDQEVVLLPLAGSSLINKDRAVQLSEVKRLSQSVGVLIDSERLAANEELTPDRQAFVETCQELEFQVHVLERRATENYLPTRAIQRVKSDKYRELSPFERLSDAQPHWDKAENWRIAREMSEEEFNATGDLADFLRSFTA